MSRCFGAKPRLPRALSVGVVDALAKPITCEILAPAMTLEEPVRVITREAPLEELLAEISAHRLDIVLSDRSMPELNVRAFSHSLGESNVAFFARSDLASELLENFPGNLEEHRYSGPRPATPCGHVWRTGSLIKNFAR